MSATYRQSSTHVAASLRDANSSLGETRPRDPDPQNRLLSRGPRFRLPAEFIRDSALADQRPVGRSPRRPQREPLHPRRPVARSQPLRQHARNRPNVRPGPRRKTLPPLALHLLEAHRPAAEHGRLRRPLARNVHRLPRPTTTPLQALVLLNDVQFVEASRAFAERIIGHSTDETENLRWAFEECTSRPPTNAELSVLTSALERERARYNANPTAAEKYLANGESLRNTKIPAPEHAAWSQVAALLLNLSETITRN